MTATWCIMRMGTGNAHLIELDTMIKRCNNLYLKTISLNSYIRYTGNTTLSFDSSNPLPEYILMDIGTTNTSLTLSGYNSNFSGTGNLEGLSFFIIKNSGNATLTIIRNAATGWINGAAADYTWTGAHAYIYRKMVMTVNTTNGRLEWLFMASD